MVSEQPSKYRQGKKARFWWLFLFVAALIVTAWFIWGWVLLPSWGLGFEKLGQFGDSFAGIGALFGGLALAGVVATLYLQRKDLELQQRELQASVREFKEQSRIMARQLALAEAQARRQYQPTFVLDGSGDHEQHLWLRIKNTGVGVRLIGRGARRQDSDQHLSVSPADGWDGGVWERGKEHRLILHGVPSSGTSYAHLMLTYEDGEGRDMTQHLFVDRSTGTTLLLLKGVVERVMIDAYVADIPEYAQG